MGSVLRFLSKVFLEEEVREGGNGGLRPEVGEVGESSHGRDKVHVALV